MRRSWTPFDCAEPHRSDRYLVLNDFGRHGSAYCETSAERADLETVISDLMSGQCPAPVLIAAFNAAEGWARDVSKDIATGIMRRLGVAGDELPPSLEAFVDRYLGSDRQLTLRLA